MTGYNLCMLVVALATVCLLAVIVVDLFRIVL